MTTQITNYSGAWKCRHWFPSSDDSHEEMSEHDVDVRQVGNELIIQSQPNDERSYLLIRLVLGDGLATGTWHEESLPSGEFRGVTYSGALQLIISEDNQQMLGQWVGMGQDAGVRKMYNGKWELVRANK